MAEIMGTFGFERGDVRSDIIDDRTEEIGGVVQG